MSDIFNQGQYIEQFLLKSSFSSHSGSVIFVNHLSSPCPSSLIRQEPFSLSSTFSTGFCCALSRCLVPVSSVEQISALSMLLSSFNEVPECHLQQYLVLLLLLLQQLLGLQIHHFLFVLQLYQPQFYSPELLFLQLCLLLQRHQYLLCLQKYR